MATVRILQQGAAKPDGIWPYTICIVANPWIESTQGSKRFIADPILNNEPAFEDKVRYIIDSLAGRLPGQAEQMFAALLPQWRIVTVFDRTRPRDGKNSLVYHDTTNMVVPRQKAFPKFLKSFALAGLGELRADVAFAVTASASHVRSSALATLDKDSGPGVPFRIDGDQMVHRVRNKLPGAVALHVRAQNMVALHEFSHAASSWNNGLITDLYNDTSSGLNKRRGRPIRPAFCVYRNRTFASAAAPGGGFAYPQDWKSYHSELEDPAFPALMDNYSRAAGNQPEKCRHDRLTRQFLLDRVQSIMAR